MPQIPEFPPLKQEDMKEIFNLYISLMGKFSVETIKATAPGFKAYTGIDEDVGNDWNKEVPFYNTGITFSQLLYTLAMTRHPLVKGITDSEFDDSKFDAKELIEQKIMKGMKILDLGSGPRPVFARCCRAMGADVWTVDKPPRLFGTYEFRTNRKLLSKEQCELEDKRHIEIDLTSKKATDVIKEKSRGEFNLVTEANLIGPGLHTDEQKRSVAMPLLKKGGVYYSVSNFRPELKE